MNTELRVATNKINLAGVVKEHELEVKAGEYQSGDKKGQPYKYIKGKLVIKAGENKEVTLKCQVNEKTSKGAVSKNYETLSRFMDGTYPTLATPNTTEEEATKVSVWGNGDFTPQIEDSIYPTQTGEIKEAVAFRLGFGNLTVKDKLTPEDYKAEFHVEMYVKSVEEEIKNDMSTGRVIVKGAMPMYGGSAMPLTVIAENVEENGEIIPFAEQVLGGVFEGQTFEFWGDIRYQTIETKVTKGGSFGRAKTETSTEFVRELVAVGGDIVDDYEKAYTVEQIQSANVEREQIKANVLRRWEEYQAEQGKSKQAKGLSGVAKPTASKPVAPMGSMAKPVPAKPAMPKPTMSAKVGF